MDEIVALRLRIPVKELGCGAQAWLAHFDGQLRLAQRTRG